MTRTTWTKLGLSAVVLTAGAASFAACSESNSNDSAGTSRDAGGAEENLYLGPNATGGAPAASQSAEVYRDLVGVAAAGRRTNR